MAINCRFISDSKEYISDEGASISKLIPKDTLLVSFKLTLGKTVITNCNLFSNEAIAAIYHDDMLLKEYLMYYFNLFDWDNYASGDVKVKGKTLNKAKHRGTNQLVWN